MKEEFEKLLGKFKANAANATKESEAAAAARNWVKCERKETESETWMEASRMLKNILNTERQMVVYRDMCEGEPGKRCLKGLTTGGEICSLCKGTGLKNDNNC